MVKPQQIVQGRYNIGITLTLFFFLKLTQFSAACPLMLLQ